MARINIDDELHAEKEYKRLARKLGDEDKAVGLLYRFWRQAQDYWGNECALMPEDEFEADGFHPILECGLAEKREEGIYAKGAEIRFDWYLQRCRASKAAVKARSKDRPDGSGEPKTNPGLPGSDSGQPAIPFRSTGTIVPDNPSATVTVPVTVTVPASDSGAGQRDMGVGGKPPPRCKTCHGSGVLQATSPINGWPEDFRCACPLGERAGSPRWPRWGPHLVSRYQLGARPQAG